MSLVAIDIGSSTIRCCLAADDGRMLHRAYSVTPMHHATDGSAEFDGDEICETTLRLIAEAAATSDRDRVRSIGFSCLGTALVPLGPDGEPIGRALSPLDTRPQPYVKDDETAARLYARTGQNPRSASSLYHLRYIRDHASGERRQAETYVSLRSLLIHRLCGVRAEDHSWASRTMLYDWATRDWADDLLEMAGVERRQMPEIVESTRAFRVNPTRVNDLGLDRGTVAVAGGLDNCCAVASRRTGIDTLTNISGTFEHLSGIVPGTKVPNFVTLGGSYAFRSLRPGEAIVCSRSTAGRAVQQLVATRQVGGDYLRCGVAPGDDRTDTGAAQEINRMLDRGCFQMRRFLESYEGSIGSVCTILVVGGGAGSAAALQRKANILGRRLAVPSETHASLVGALRCAWIAAHDGVWSDEALPTENGIARIVEPDPIMHAAFEQAYSEYADE